MLNENRESAAAKINLCLFVGGPRADGRHELVTLFESIDLSDELVFTPAPAGEDEVVCPGVSGENLVTQALAGLRAAGWAAPPVRVEIGKRIPVAAGMGGGSADAAAMLRFAPRLSPVPVAALEAIAAGLGADVPSRLAGGPSLGTGAGEIVAAVPNLDDHSVLVLPQPFGLSTADVYREADRLELPRSAGELADLRLALEATLVACEHVPQPLPERLILNDLQPAALSLAPEIGVALELAREAGAEQALVCGSGPSVIGIFWGSDGLRRAEGAAKRLRGRFSGAAASGVTRGAVLASS